MRPERAEVTLVVNGRELRLAAPVTVADVLRHLEQDPRVVAVEHGGEIVSRADYATTELTDGARIEVVRFVQGG